MPKIKLQLSPVYPAEEAFEFEEAKTRLDFENGIVLVEGQKVNSYDELLKLAGQEKYKNKEFIEVTVVLYISGG